MSILTTSWPILVEMIDLVNSVSILLCQISSDTSIFSTVAFLASYSDHVVVSFSIDYKLRKGCYSSLHSFWLFSCWFIWFLWSFEKCSRGGYLYTCCFCCCYWILWVGPGWSCCIYPFSLICQALLISLVFSCFSYCHSS